MKSLLPLAAVAALSGCASATTPGSALAEPQQWRSVATAADRERLRDWRKAFTTALERARAAGHGAAIARESALLVPDAALGGVPIPNGDYRCRVIKLGAKTPGLLDYIAYPAFRCRITAQGGVQRFAKLGGSQRPVGTILPGDALRQMFLGTLVLGDETGALPYGRDAERDLAALVEKVGPARWRMVFPYPAFESLTDVIELVPIATTE